MIFVYFFVWIKLLTAQQIETFFFSPQRIWHSYPNYDVYFTDRRPSCFYCHLLLFSWPLFVSLLVSSPIHSCSSIFPFVNRLHQHITLLIPCSPLIPLLIFPLELLSSTASSRYRKRFCAFHSAAWDSSLLEAVVTRDSCLPLQWHTCCCWMPARTEAYSGQMRFWEKTPDETSSWKQRAVNTSRNPQ